jgi:translocation and assembly module TamA
MIRTIRTLFLLLACSLMTGCSYFKMPFANGEETDLKIRNDVDRTVEYKVIFSGVDRQQKHLLDTMRQTSTSLRLLHRPPPTGIGLIRRAEDDIEQFQAVLRSFGFYDGRVTFEIDDKPTEQSSDPPAKPVVLEYLVDTGTPYLLAEAELVIIGPDNTVQRPMDDEEWKASGLTPGMQAMAAPIIAAEQRAVDIFRTKSYPLAKAGKRKVTADTAEKTLSVGYQIITGRKADFGGVTVFGAKTIDPDFIAGYRSWQAGKPFSPDELTATQRELAKSNLFDSAIVRPAESVNDRGEIPIEILVTERKHRTVGGGINYSTADGIGANVFWEHRNLFGAGERLRLYLDGSQLQQGFEANFRKPQFLERRQDLVIEGQGKEFTTDAYEGELVNSFAGIERRFAEHWSATVGVIAEYSDLTGADSPNENFYLGGLRGLVRRDSTNNPLDPTTGNRLELAVSPLTSLAGASTQFVSVSLHGAHYHPFDKAGRYVLAGRGQLGAVWGEERPSLPANKRFYSGGGGSIRGYEYQKVGPLDANNDPIGGLSVIEAGMEFRARVTESVGVVPFVEGGNVFEQAQPDHFDMQWAAGLGLRYYTAIGPLRFDFAVPLNKRENIDDDFQIYISIGQAF